MSSPTHVDPRGQRFAAAITAVVVAAALVSPRPVTIVLLVVQTLVFATGAFVNLARSPYALVFARFVRPRLAPPTELEDARPPRFAQTVGFVFTGVALVAFVVGLSVVGYVFTAFALVAAVLNASIGLCLGCELYLAFQRLGAARA